MPDPAPPEGARAVSPSGRDVMADPSAQELLRIRILFESRTKAFLRVESSLKYDPKQLEGDKIQLFALAFARVFQQLGSGEQKAMFTDFCQRVLKTTVTSEGLRRPTIMIPGQTLLEAAPRHPQGQALIRLVQENDGRLAEWVLPATQDEGLTVFICAVFYLQHLIRVLSDASLFSLMLVLGGLMEYYEQGGDPADPASLTEAPKYAFGAVQKYVEEHRRG